MSLIARILLTASIGAIGSVGITLWASSLALSRYWINNIARNPPYRMVINATRCDQGQLPPGALRFGQRTVDFYARDSLIPARTDAPTFPVALAFDARKGNESGVRLGGIFGGGTVGYHRFPNAERCGIAVIRLIRSPISRAEVQLLGVAAALLAALTTTLGAYFIVARPMLRRVAAAANAAGQVGSARFVARNDDDWSDLALIDEGLSSAHDRIMANERVLAGRAGEIEQLLSAIAHDLKTPLAIIQLILQQSSHSPEAATDIGRAMAEVQHANALLENLELGAQLRSGDLVAGFTPVDLTAIVEDSAARFTLVGKSLGLVVEAAWPDPPLLAQGDAVLFSRIISNLVYNALRHSGGKHVALWMSGDTRWAYLRITDDGVGLPLVAQQTLIAPKDTGNDDRLTTIGVHGRGLTIVRRLSALMGIMIEIEAASPSGSSILLKIPLLVDEPAPIILK